MDFLTRFGLQKSRLTVLVMTGLLLLGVLTYIDLPKRENPAITIRSAVVTAQFPGMSPERAEDLLAIPLERAARENGVSIYAASLFSVGPNPPPNAVRLALGAAPDESRLRRGLEVIARLLEGHSGGPAARY